MATLSKFKKFILWSALVFAVVLSVAIYSKNNQLQNGGRAHFYQSYYEPAVRVACGQDFGVANSGNISQNFKNFLNDESTTLSCNDVSKIADLNPNPPTRAWLYQFETVAIIWKIFGISWSHLYTYDCVVLALSGVIIFYIFALFTPLTLSAILAVISTVPGINYLLQLRDLSKMPFILICIFIAFFLVIRKPSTYISLIGMLIAGVITGIGYGFRPDTIISIPFLIIAFTFFIPRRSFNLWLTPAIGITLLLAGFFIAASPIFYFFQSGAGSCQWHFMILGLANSFFESLGIPYNTYSLLPHYSDGLVDDVISSYANRELLMPAFGFCSKEYDIASQSYYFSLVKLFPLDFFIQFITAMSHVREYGFWQFIVEIKKIISPIDLNISNSKSLITLFLNFSWLAALFAVLQFNLRIGLFFVFTLIYLSVYPALQFEARHFFHLSFLAWLPVAILTSFALNSKYSLLTRYQMRENLLTFSRSLLIISSLVGVLFFTFIGLNYLQETNLKNFFSSYLIAKGKPIELKFNTSNPSILKIPPPSNDNKITALVNEGMLRVKMSINHHCIDGSKIVTVKLFNTSGTQIYTQTYNVNLDQVHDSATLFYPAYFRGNEGFIEVSTVDSDALCITSMEWVNSNELPAIWVSNTIYSRAEFYYSSHRLSNIRW